MIQSENQKPKIILPEDLVCMNDYADTYPLSVDLVYAQTDNYLLGEAVYRPQAKLWLHKCLAHIVCRAAETVYQQYGYTMVLYDGLRTVDAQALMLKTRRVQDNPHWLEEPRLLSPPGAGGHPRGMAVDVSLMTDGVLLDMGTPFDDLTPKAHRHYDGLTAEQHQNRNILYDVMIEAGRFCYNAGESISKVIGLPQEWWDFRFPRTMYELYTPLSDADLPVEMQVAAA